MAKQLILITGVTAGTGLALVKRYIEDGHTVVGCGRNKSMIDELNNKYSKDGSIFRVVDISDKENVKKFSNEILDLKGPPSFLINNAGMGTKGVNIVDMSTELFENIIDINVKGTFYVIHYFLPSMIKAGHGIIVNFTSGWGRVPGAGQTAYCCSKYGLEGFSKSIALELPPPMACIPLNPGLINTTMLQNCFGKDFANTQRTPDQWATDVGGFILGLDRGSNGESLIVPGEMDWS